MRRLYKSFGVRELNVIVLMSHKEILYCWWKYFLFAWEAFTNLIPRNTNGAGVKVLQYFDASTPTQ
jgi:hypothetical protein